MPIHGTSAMPLEERVHLSQEIVLQFEIILAPLQAKQIAFLVESWSSVWQLVLIEEGGRIGESESAISIWRS